MSNTFKFSIEERISWPPICVACGKENPTFVKTHGSNSLGMGFGLFGPSVKYGTITIKFPLCTSHLVLFKLSRFVYLLSFLVLIFLIVALFGWNEIDSIQRVYLIASILVSVMVFTVAAIAQPVHVSGTSQGGLKIKISKDEYSEAFKEANNYGD